MKISTQGLDPDDIIKNTDLDRISEIPETPTEDNSMSLKSKLMKIDKSKIKLKKPISIVDEP
jgi:hypothetical protein